MRVITHLALWRLGLVGAETQTTPAERDCLSRYASGRRRLVEIGVWHGVTTMRLRSAMASDGILFAVDPFVAGRLGFSAQRYIAHREVAKIGNGTVEWVRLTGAQAAYLHREECKGLVDFVFIDADHSYDAVRADWEGWNPLVIRGGVVALHDSRSTATRSIESAGSVRYTNDVILNDPRFVQVDTVDSLTIVQRGIVVGVAIHHSLDDYSPRNGGIPASGRVRV